MNFLAHIYLSGNIPEVQIGNFIGDFVKGNKYLRYSDQIQKGIILHRKIDSFTDKHQIVKQSSSLLRDKYKRYSGVVIDLFYDHFLAANWHLYSNEPLAEYVTRIHKLFIKNYFKLPGEVKSFLPFLIRNRRLEHYQHTHGIEKALAIMTQYTSLPEHVDFAMLQLKNHYDEIQNDFMIFFDDIRNMVAKELNGQANF